LIALGKVFWGVLSMTVVQVPAVVAAALSLAACASIAEGTSQQIYVTTTPETGAACTASNGRGEWDVVTPGTVTVKKSETVLKIRCSKPGWKDATVYAAGKISTANLVGNMLPYVGLLNAAVDASTGAALTYPGSYTIELKPLTAGGVVPAPGPAASAWNAPASSSTDVHPEQTR
jgi:hypothetical protein